MKQGKIFILVILFIFLVKGIFLTFVIPPWDAPDESTHMSYVLWLHNFKKLPTSSWEFTFASVGESFSESKKRLALIRQGKIAQIEKTELFNRTNNTLMPGLVGVSSYPPIYYFYLLPFYIFSLNFSSYFCLIFLRIASVLLGLASIWLSYRLAKKIDKHLGWASPLMILLLCLQPQFAFISSVINSDNMVVFFFLLFLNKMFDFFQKDSLSHKDLFWLAIIVGLSALTKPQLVILIPLFVYGIVLNRKKIINKWSYTWLTLSILPLFWYLRQFLVKEGATVNSIASNMQKPSVVLWRYPIDFILGKQFIGIFMSFWAYFGLINIPLPEASYFLFLVPMFLSTFGWYFLVKNGIGRISNWLKESHHKFLLISFLFYIGIIVAYDIFFYSLTGSFSINGRYFFPILPLILLFFAKGVFLYPKKFQRNLIFVVIGFFILANIVSLFTLNNKYYGRNLPNYWLVNTYKFWR